MVVFVVLHENPRIIEEQYVGSPVSLSAKFY